MFKSIESQRRPEWSEWPRSDASKPFDERSEAPSMEKITALCIAMCILELSLSLIYLWNTEGVGFHPNHSLLSLWHITPEYYTSTFNTSCRYSVIYYKPYYTFLITSPHNYTLDYHGCMLPFLIHYMEQSSHYNIKRRHTSWSVNNMVWI